MNTLEKTQNFNLRIRQRIKYTIYIFVSFQNSIFKIQTDQKQRIKYCNIKEPDGIVESN